MSQAPTPAPHVPVNFLKAGGTAFFSAECIALLAKFGYEADEFGSYDHTLSRLRQARETCHNYDNGIPNADGSPPRPPTARERELGRPLTDPGHYEAGHLGMNTCMQGSRDDPCSNFVNGHDMGTYPCMPHQGSALDPGSEHNVWTQQEVDTPLNRPGARPRGPYTGDINADADARVQTLLDNRGEVAQPTGTPASQGGRVAGADPSAPGAASAAGGAAPGSTAPNGMPESARVTGDTAAECISNFRKGAESGMRAAASDSETIAQNRAAAGTPAERQAAATAAADARARADAAERELRSSQSSLGGHTTALNNARDRAQGVPTQEQAAAIDRSTNNVAAATARRDAALAASQQANQEAATAQARSSRMENANCRANQGAAINNGDNGAPRNPGRWDDLPRTPSPPPAAPRPTQEE